MQFECKVFKLSLACCAPFNSRFAEFFAKQEIAFRMRNRHRTVRWSFGSCIKDEPRSLPFYSAEEWQQSPWNNSLLHRCGWGNKSKSQPKILIGSNSNLISIPPARHWRTRRRWSDSVPTAKALLIAIGIAFSAIARAMHNSWLMLIQMRRLFAFVASGPAEFHESPLKRTTSDSNSITIRRLITEKCSGHVPLRHQRGENCAVIRDNDLHNNSSKKLPRW